MNSRWNISAWSIRSPIPSIVLFLLLTIAGWVSFRSLGVDVDPNIDVPIVTVAVTETGAAPSELEAQVTRKVEDSLAGIGHIKHLYSTVNEGLSVTVIEFELGTSADRATNDVRDAVSRIRQQLPQAINDPIVERQDFTGGHISTYTVESKSRSVDELSWIVDNNITRALQAVPGVGQVVRSGGTTREIRVELDPVRLEAHGLTADAVSSQIRSLNVNLPGGRGDVGAVEQSIRTLGSAHTLEQLKAERVALPNGGWARLDTLGNVTDGSSEPRQAALLNGTPVVSFGIVRSTGSNMVGVDRRVDEALDNLRATLPSDVRVTKVRSMTPYVMESYHASFDSLILGAILAVIVIWIFLRDWRAALISALAMPLSVIPTFAVISWLGFTLNWASLLGLALVIGILVDDAIVEIENIVRHMNMGKSAYVAALEAADEIGLAVVATTMTIIVVFLPVAFMGGIPGQFFKQFGLTVAIAVFFSLLVARLITPMMTAWWMKAPSHPSQERSRLMRAYDRLLEWAMVNRLATIILAVGFFIFSMVLFQSMPSSLESRTDNGETKLTIEQPPGASLVSMVDAAKQATKILLAHPEVAKAYARIGGGDSNSVNQGSIYVVLKPRNERNLSQQHIEDLIRPELKRIAGVRCSFGDADDFSGKLRVLLASDDPDALQQEADALVQQMRQLPGLFDVTSTAALQRPEILVRPDFALAAEQGVSIASIARTALIATMGDVDQNLPRYDLADRQIYIRVQLDPRCRGNMECIRNLKVAGSDGRLVPLDSVAHIEMGQGPSQIDRYNRHRQVSVNASLSDDVTLGQAIERVHNLPAFKSMPASVREIPAGAAEIQKDVFTCFAWAMGAAVLFIYAVLVLLFSGFLQPLTIMVPLPLSIGGAVMGLILTHNSLDMFALIGIVMLMGLATKNSILLVEYSLMAMHNGVPRNDAIVQSGEARMRPILMTTVAMIAGMIPIALGIGAGSEERAPMAIAVIGGLITSTFLTLVVVPVVFTCVDDVKSFFSRLIHRDHGDGGS